MELERIYHPFWLWEDHKNGFYDNVSGAEKIKKKKSVIEMFSSPELTEINMKRVIDEWCYSCEHNLTNLSLNRIAYIGQSACCIFDGIPSTITMETWSELSKEVQDRANIIADAILQLWIKKHTNA